MNVPQRLRVELDTGERRSVPIPAGEPLLAEVLSDQGLPLDTRCGRRGSCRGCEVELRAGELAVGGVRVASPATVQACQARVVGPAEVFIPARSRLTERGRVGDTFEISRSWTHRPLFPRRGGRDTWFAADIGTTTVAVLLVDAVSGEVLSRAGGFNAQARFGDNVITRIDAAREPGVRAALRRAVVDETLGPLLNEACAAAGRPLDRIVGGAVAGNTTMLHLFTGEDPASLGVVPFTPRFVAGRQVTAGGVGLHAGGLEPTTPVQLLPGIAAYVGADVVAGIVATGMGRDPAPCLLVDIGTNGEIVLHRNGRFTACATAAGPAFEGCGLRHGMRACEGAVSEVDLALEPFRLAARVIGDVPLKQAAGLCGSAYVDFLATARSAGLVGECGRFERAAWESIPSLHRGCDDGTRDVRLAGGVGISEVDIALLLQAKAAIGAGIETLLNAAGVPARDVERLYLAGGFGMHLNVAHAIAIGLLPGFGPEQVCVVGNTSLAGAVLALRDRELLDEMEEVRCTAEVIELNLTDGFEDRFVDHLMLP